MNQYLIQESDRERYEGEFNDDERCGVGVLTDLYGHVFDVKYSLSGNANQCVEYVSNVFHFRCQICQIHAKCVWIVKYSPFRTVYIDTGRKRLFLLHTRTDL